MPGKILRVSMYRHAWDKRPTTVVVRACDLKTSPEHAVAEMEAVSPGAFVASDVFEVDDATYGDPVRAAIAGVRRLEDSARLYDEMSMALCYYWNADALRRVSPGGVLASTRPAPLSEDQLRVVLRQLRHHPNYERQTITQITSDGKMLTVRDGGVG